MLTYIILRVTTFLLILTSFFVEYNYVYLFASLPVGIFWCHYESYPDPFPEVTEYHSYKTGLFQVLGVWLVIVSMGSGGFISYCSLVLGVWLSSYHPQIMFFKEKVYEES